MKVCINKLSIVCALYKPLWKNTCWIDIIKLFPLVKYSRVQWSTVKYIIVHSTQYSTVQYSIVHSTQYVCVRSIILLSRDRGDSSHSTVQYSTVQCSAVQYGTVRYSTVQYSTETE